MAGIGDLLELSERRCGDSAALLAPGRPALSFAGLAGQSRHIGNVLKQAGIRTEDRVAVVLPNGPEMAAAFLAIASHAGCAPLNPNYTREDFAFYLGDLRARALVASEGAPIAALEAARAAGVPVMTLHSGERAGEFDIECPGAGPAIAAGSGTETGCTEPAALLLHTSGTTSRPKLVPLSGANLTASAAHVAATLQLTPQDRCLNIMPLFHIHGLIAAVLASLHAGASVVCTDGVYANQFFTWLEEFQPTWYTAVPTMHQAILARAAQHAGVVARARLRFIRSSSASLPPAVMAELERTFSAPVVEAYGMTEAAHQMASNPLPPLARKPGSVGLAAGPEVAIMDDQGALLEACVTGEVVIRGPNVTRGYEANAAANASAFTDGWFRTGDQGWMDTEGYLFLTGRLKELINRGGEKIAPREVDEALLAHPAVRQALTFAVPHAQLGEEVGAAVELEPGKTASTAELRAWVAARLPAFKVPRVVRIVEAIPKGPTGKLQRIGLAAKLGIEPMDDQALGDYVAPRNETETRIAGIWRELLPGARTGVEDRFEGLGGDSLLAVRMLAAVSEHFGADVPYQEFVELGTIASLARAVERPREAGSVVELARGAGTPLVCVPGHDGVLLGLTRMAHELNGAVPVWGLDFAKLPEATSVSELAGHCTEALTRRQPHGPYRLAGVCFGGCVALEMARELQARGETVELLALVDTLNPDWARHQSSRSVAAAWLRNMGIRTAYHCTRLRRMGMRQALRYLAGRSAMFFRNKWELTAGRYGHGSGRYRELMRVFRPGEWTGDALVVRRPGRHLDAPLLGWSSIVRGKLEVADVPFELEGSLAGENAGRVAALIRARLGAR